MSNLNIAYLCFTTLSKHGFKNALIGGVAVSSLTEERFTRDLDFSVAVKSDNDAEYLLRILQNNSFILEQIFEHKPTKTIALAVLESPKIGKMSYRIDLIFNQSGIESEVVKGSKLYKVNSKQSIKIASIGHLIALKTLSMDDINRPLDKSDIINLLKVAKKKDIETAREAVRLITKRGFNQKKDLLSSLQKMIKLYFKQ